MQKQKLGIDREDHVVYDSSMSNDKSTFVTIIHFCFNCITLNSITSQNQILYKLVNEKKKKNVEKNGLPYNVLYWIDDDKLRFNSM